MSFTYWRRGSIVTKLQLEKQFGNTASLVLANRLEQIIKEKPKERTKYTVVQDLPSTMVEYRELSNNYFKTNVDSLISGAFDEIEELAQEMEDAYENTPASLQDSVVGSARRDAADTLQSICRVDLEPEIGNLELIFIPHQNQTSRSKRASCCADMLRSASTRIEDHLEELRAKVDSEEDDFLEIESIISDLDEAADEIDGIEFPGMYG